MVSCFSSDIKAVGVGKSDFRQASDAIYLFEWINSCLEPHRFGKKDLLYMSPAEKDGLYIAKTVILKVFYIVCPITALWLTHPLFWLSNKKWGLQPLCTYVDGIAVKFEVLSWLKCIYINVCTNLLSPVGLMCTTVRVVLFGLVWP